MTDIFLAIGDLVESTFSVFPALGNAPNKLFLVVGLIASLYWVAQLMKAEKEEA